MLLGDDDRASAAINEWPDNMPLDEQVERLASLLLDRFGGPTRSEGAIEMACRLLVDLDEEPLRWQFEVAPNTLFEIQTMDVLEQMFRSLDDGEIGRILRWANDKYAGENGSEGAQP